jgi:alpha-amylase
MSFQALDWVRDTNIYEVNLRQYTSEGTFVAFSKNLPRLKDMGVEVLWFMPITPISQDKRLGSLGSYYACSDYQATNPEFGSLDDFKLLVKLAHSFGFKVIIDWVANHTGWDHRWTREHPEFYKRDSNGHFYDSNGWEDVIDLNYDSRDLRQAMVSAMAFWIKEADIDGFRCDMAMLVTIDFWKEARMVLDAIKKLFWLAECEDIPYLEVFDALYAWKFLHKMEAFCKAAIGIPGLDDTLEEYDRNFPPTALNLFFTSNHDENSHNGTEYERLGDAAKVFSVLCCTWNGLPLIYSGQEMPNYKRLRFFDKDPIQWTGQYELHDFYKTLLNLRKKNPALAAGNSAVSSFRLQGSLGQSIFGLLRRNGACEILVMLNLSPNLSSFDLTDPQLKGVFKNSFTQQTLDVEFQKTIDLESWGFRVFEKNSLT